MIIVEGPDGTGKSNLTKWLVEQLGIPQAERQSSSATGPVNNLYHVACRDVDSWPDRSTEIYDRHAFISEYIYGPTVRGRVHPGFDLASSVVWRRKVARDSLVILALPPLDVAQANARNDTIVQMEGVVSNYRRIYAHYSALPMTWPGWVVLYDYRAPMEDKKGRLSILRACRLHIAQREGNRP